MPIAFVYYLLLSKPKFQQVLFSVGCIMENFASLQRLIKKDMTSMKGSLHPSNI